jgi:hypothetical protein
MATKETTSATLEAALPKERRKGRKPMARSNAHECRDKITTWKLIPEKNRQPATLTALAAELGISKQMASYYAQQVPESVEELVDSAEREALGRYPDILKTLGDLAEKGSVEAIKVYIRELAGPRRPEQRKPSAMAQDITLQLAIQNLIQPPQETKPTNARLTVENGPTNKCNRQIPSNSDSDEKSTS